jgi:hypothetical protein
MRKPKCKYCEREVFWTVVGVKAHDDGTLGPNRRAFDFTPVPTATCRVMAVVLHRTKGLLDVHNVADPPAECYPIHRCPQYTDALVFDELDQLRVGSIFESMADSAVDAMPMLVRTNLDIGRDRDANAS